MRKPTSWDDKSLLEEYPLQDLFLMRALSGPERRGKRHSEKFNDVVIKRIRENCPDHKQAVRAWLDAAFSSVQGDVRKKVKFNNRALWIFVEFYWLLHQDPEAALRYLNHERSLKGFTYALQWTEKTKATKEFVADTANLTSPQQDENKTQTPTYSPLNDPGKAILLGTAGHRVLSRPVQLKLARKAKAKAESIRMKRSVAKSTPQASFPNAPSAKPPREPDTSCDQILLPSLRTEDHSIPNQLSGVAISKDSHGGLQAPPPGHDSMDGSIEHLKHWGQPLDIIQVVECNSTTQITDDTLQLTKLTYDKKVIPLIPNPVATPPHDKSRNDSLIGDSPHFPKDPSILGVLSIQDTALDEAGGNYKPPLPMLPPIWAQSRQELCESFDWFRSYQSGVYHWHNITKGYLLSAFSSRRDRFEHEGRLIISHGGGKGPSLHSKKGHISNRLADDQLAQDKSVRALLQNYNDRRPLVLLVDDKYTLFPYDLGAKDITYAVLGFYTIVHAWAEYQPASNARGTVVRYKFAFQWCDGQGEPWWIHKSNDNTSDPEKVRLNSFGDVAVPRTRNTPTKLPPAFVGLNTQPSKAEDLYITCCCCGVQTPHVYQRDWVCLNSDCDEFWTHPDGNPLPDQVDYNVTFLKLMPTPALPPGFEKLYPVLPAMTSNSGSTTNYAFSRGCHCVECGRLSCRIKWEYWECSFCNTLYKVEGKTRTAENLWSLSVPAAFRDHFVARQSGIKQSPVTVFSHQRDIGKIQTFILPHDRGRIHHIQAGHPLRNLEADEIFEQYQEEASKGKLAFRRWPLRTHKLRGPLLTNYFSQNTGEPYQYVGGTANTVPFSEAPNAVVKARDYISKRIREALGIEIPINEVLSAAYMERQKMAFHSDSERGLGPIIAGLSLGSPALMHFRLHAKHEPVKQQRSIAMSFVLRHGDILVMEGHRVQEYYEHAVVPSDFRISATARWIQLIPPVQNLHI